MQASLLVTLVTLLAASYVGCVCADSNATNATVANPDDWYLEDHPYLYNMDKIRLANGTWVANPNFSMPPMTATEYYSNLTAKLPFFVRWYVVGPTNKIRQGFTDFRTFVIFNMVSPMDYGLGQRAQSVRRQWHEAITKFWWKMVGKTAVKKQAANFRSILTYGISNYVESRVFARKVATYNSTQWAMEMNWTQDKIDYMRERIKESLRVKIVTPYHYVLPADLGKLVQEVVPGVKEMVQFQPYVNYTTRYYDASEVLPPPTLPAAISYPWPWHSRLEQVRYIILDVMHTEADAKKTAQEEEAATQIGKDAADKAEAEAQQVATHQVQAGDEVPSNTPETAKPPSDFGNEATDMVEGRRLQADSHSEDSEYSSDGGSSSGSDSSSGSGSDIGSGSGSAGNETALAAVQRRVKMMLREFHFATGIPRMELMKTHYRLLLFPNLDEFNSLALHEQNEGEGGQPQAPILVDPSEAGVEETSTSNATDYETRAGVYEAARSFYSYPVMENNLAFKTDLLSPLKSKRPFADIPDPHDFAQCSVETPCIIHSAVTVYTPSLRDAVREIFSSVASVSADSQRLTRRDWLLTLFEDSFDVENRVLKSGLMAPSTAWNSFFDRSTDLLADGVFGLVNASKTAALERGEKLKPRSVYEALTVNDPKAGGSPLFTGNGYYRTSNGLTTSAMNVTRVLPYHEPFTVEDRFYLIAFLRRKMHELQQAIDAYEYKRDADMMHRAMVNATQTHSYYDGRMFTLLGFGYLLPATNEYGVAYRDHKLPVPFHLVLRLMVRFQESRLLLEEESLQIVACLAMLQFDVQYYRCVEGIAANQTITTASPGDGSAASPAPVSQNLTMQSPANAFI